MPMYSNKSGYGGGAGSDGKDIEFNWDGTKLGVRQEGEDDYKYTDLRGEQGEPGKQGKPGSDGDPGKNGDDGVGISDIERDGNTLVFKMTDNSEIEVDLPDDESEGE